MKSRAVPSSIRMKIILYFHDQHYTQRKKLPGFLPATYFSLTIASTLLILEFLLPSYLFAFEMLILS